SIEIREPALGGWTRRSLLALQSALCLALLFSAGLFSASLNRVMSLDYGVDLDRTLQVGYNLRRDSRTQADVKALYARALDQVQQLPGVERAALSQEYPFNSGSGIAPFTADASQEQLWKGRPGGVGYTTYAGAHFFSALGTTSLIGRDFTEDDKSGSPRVTILNGPLAQLLFPKGNALGQCIFLGPDRECFRVVGIVGGVWKIIALDRGRMAVYLPLAQDFSKTPGALMVRVQGNRAAVLSDIRRTMQSIESGLPAVSVKFAGELLAREVRPWRLGATMFVGFALVALVIAAIGVYGVVSFATTQRMPEIGIRLALGATGAHIVRLVAGSGIGAVLGGLAVGAAASLIASRWMGAVLYQTSPRDPFILAEAALVLLAIAATAIVRPLVRALRLNPAIVLRAE
ncbi:MAG TPA: ABC transporter permease, partial [Gemmatimonadaceae bacterium]